MDYLFKAASAWFVGFFPLAEIYVAIPSAIALGLDDISVIVWCTFGNFTPALLINTAYQWMMKNPRINKWFASLISEKVKSRINKWGIWFVLLGTPWTGIWVMSVTAKVLGMNTTRFLISAFISILAHAIIILIVLRAGIATFS